MRSFLALAVYVFLWFSPAPASSPAGDWSSLQEDGANALRRGEYQRATRLFRDAAQVAQGDPERAVSATSLGMTLHQLSLDTEAGRELEKALTIWRTLNDREIQRAQAVGALAAVDRNLGRYAEAEALLRMTLETPPVDADSHALILNELADILRETGRDTEAYRLFQGSTGLPGVSQRRQLDAIIGMADLDRNSHSWQASLEGWNKATAIARERHWPTFEAVSVRGLGITWLEHGDAARAEPLLRRALGQLEALNVAGNQLATTLSCLGQLYLQENKLAMAEENLLRALGISETMLGPNHPQHAVLLEMLGASAAARKQLGPARDYFERAHLIMAKQFGEQSPMAAAVDASWALIEQRSNRNAEAAADFEKALAVLNTAGPDVRFLRLTVAQHYAEVCKALHRKSPGKTAFKDPSMLTVFPTTTPMPQSH